MSDLINRQDAINALGEEPEIWNDTEEEWAYRNAWVEHISAINALPSSEPCDKDAISREGLLKSWEELSPRGRTEFDQVIMTIPALPSADRPTGEWEIETDTDEYGLKRPKLVCSKCEKEPVAWDLTELFEFCPNCGAKMKGADDED